MKHMKILCTFDYNRDSPLLLDHSSVVLRVVPNCFDASTVQAIALVLAGRTFDDALENSLHLHPSFPRTFLAFYLGNKFGSKPCTRIHLVIITHVNKTEKAIYKLIENGLSISSPTSSKFERRRIDHSPSFVGDLISHANLPR
jgi:hypothetical protein